jgi:repressor LexA
MASLYRGVIMATLGTRIKEARSLKGITQVELGRLLGTSDATINRYEKDIRKPDPDTLNNIAKVLNVSTDWLLCRIEQKEFDIADLFQSQEITITAGGVPLTQDQRLKLLQTLNNIPPLNTIANIPILDQIHAGLSILAEENWEGKIGIPSYLSAGFALRVEGDSMTYAGILNGDIAIFQESNTAAHGQIVAAGIEESTWQAYLKFYIEKNGQVFLRSANPEYTDIEYSPIHRIIGVLVGVIREQSPNLNDYHSILQVKGYEDKQWVEVMEKAAGYGIKPDKINSIMEMHWEMLNKK